MRGSKCPNITNAVFKEYPMVEESALKVPQVKRKCLGEQDSDGETGRCGDGGGGGGRPRGERGRTSCWT